jgi:hypothetical protein
MFSTSLTMIPLAVLRWHWGIVQASLLFGGFAAIEVMFLLANTLKFAEGGFVPLLIGGGLFVAMTNYHWGRIGLLASAYAAFATRRDMRWFLDLKQRLMDHSGVLRDNQRDLKEAERTDVFMTSRPVTQKTDGVPVTGTCLAVRFIKLRKMCGHGTTRDTYPDGLPAHHQCGDHRGGPVFVACGDDPICPGHLQRLGAQSVDCVSAPLSAPA